MCAGKRMKGVCPVRISIASRKAGTKAGNRVESSQMSGVDWAKLEELRAKGASKLTFHADGSLASIEFAPSSASSDERQREKPKDPPRARAVGGLVPRVDISSD